MAFAYTVLLDSVLARPLMPSWSNYLQGYIISPAASALLVGSFLPAMASLNGCYLQWLCLCSCYLQWLYSSGVCGFPFRFDCDGVSRPYSLLGFLLGFSPVSVRDSLCARTTPVGSLRIGRAEWAGYAGPPSFLGSAMAFIACAVYGVLSRALTAMASEPIWCLGVPSLFWCEGR